MNIFKAWGTIQSDHQYFYFGVKVSNKFIFSLLVYLLIISIRWNLIYKSFGINNNSLHRVLYYIAYTSKEIQTNTREHVVTQSIYSNVYLHLFLNIIRKLFCSKYYCCYVGFLQLALLNSDERISREWISTFPPGRSWPNK